MTLENELVSVIIPVFNAQNYLTACLESVVNQSYRNLEIILVDDGSTDQSGAICDDFASRDTRITVLHQANGGPSLARNAGLDCAKGKWVTFVDSDDYIAPDMVEYLLSKAQEYNADLVQCGFVKEKAGRTELVSCPSKEVVLPDGAKSFLPETWRWFNNGNCGKLYRREVIGDTRFDPRCRIGEDLQFNLRILMQPQCVVLATQAKYYYVMTEGSLFRSAPSGESLRNCREMLNRLEQEVAENPMILERVRAERYRNALDICSKIVCFRMENETDFRHFLQKEIRKRIRTLLDGKAFSTSEKLKFMLIAYVWPLYRVLLLWSKRM